MPCSCGMCYIEQVTRTVLAHCDEQFAKLALAKHCGNNNNQALFDSVKVLEQVDNYWQRVICKALEISVDSISVNKYIGIMIMDSFEGQNM